MYYSVYVGFLLHAWEHTTTLSIPCSSIQLLTLANSSMISKYGIDKILKPIIDELKELESVSYIPFFFVIHILFVLMFLSSCCHHNGIFYM